MTENDNKKAWNDLVARYYGDSDFTRRFDSDPAGVLKEMGMEVPEGMKLHVHKNTETDVHITLPPDPTSELNEKTLGSIYGGKGEDAPPCGSGCDG